MKKNKIEKFVCPNCGLQEAEVDEKNIAICPNCNRLVSLAPIDKERVKINQFQKNQ